MPKSAPPPKSLHFSTVGRYLILSMLQNLPIQLQYAAVRRGVRHGSGLAIPSDGMPHTHFKVMLWGGASKTIRPGNPGLCVLD